MDRILYHLWLLEHFTGYRCRTVPRSYEERNPVHLLYGDFCIIEKFAPNKDKENCAFLGTGFKGEVRYRKGNKENIYPIYSADDFRWWSSLDRETRLLCLRWLEELFAKSNKDQWRNRK